MMTSPNDYLSTEDLRAIKTVIRGAIDRASRPVDDAVNLADRRRGRVMRGKLGLTRKTRACASPVSAGVVRPFPGLITSRHPRLLICVTARRPKIMAHRSCATKRPVALAQGRRGVHSCFCATPLSLPHLSEGTPET
jgi:hypothetical protein